MFWVRGSARLTADATDDAGVPSASSDAYVVSGFSRTPSYVVSGFSRTRTERRTSNRT
jgi:hypothetical protein